MKKVKKYFTIPLLALICLFAGCFNTTKPYTFDDLPSQQEVDESVFRLVDERYTLVSENKLIDSEGFPQVIYTYRSAERDLTFECTSYFYRDKVTKENFGHDALPEISEPTYLPQVTSIYQEELDKIVNTYSGEQPQDWFAEQKFHVDDVLSLTLYHPAHNRPGKLFVAKTPEQVDEFADLCIKCNELFKDELNYARNPYNDGYVYYNFIVWPDVKDTYTYIIPLTGKELSKKDIMRGYLKQKSHEAIPGYEEYVEKYYPE